MSDSKLQAPRLLRSTTVTGSVTLLSRISGLVRDKVLSFAFGSAPLMDAFFVAFKIPNLLRRFFAEGAFAQAFVPVLSEYRVRRDHDEVRALIARTSGTLGGVLFLVTAIGVVLAPVLIYLFAPGFDAEDGRRDMAVAMLRLTFPYLFFISLTALAGAVLNSFDRFAVPALTPVLLNLVLIGFAFLAAAMSEHAALVLAGGVFVAGLVQLLFQLPFVAALGVASRPQWAWQDSGVRRILKLMLPVLLGSSVAQINILFDTLLASLLAAGSITWLYYSDRLVEFPLGVFGIALATVIMPALSRHHAEASQEQFSRTLDWALHLVLLIGLPAAIGLIMLAEPLIATIFLGGAFNAGDVAMAGASLRAFAPGLIAFILVKVLAPGFFARQDTRTPVRIAIRALLFGMVLNVVFVLTLLHTGWAPAHAGLAAATSLSSFFNASLLFVGLRREGIYSPGPGWLRFFGQVLAAASLMTMFLVLISQRFGDFTQMTGWQRVWGLVLSVGIAIAVYAGACLIVGIRPSRLRAPVRD